MEFRRRSLWNRVWEGENLDLMGNEEYARRVYEGEGYEIGDRWREVGYGILLSAWKGVQWLWSGVRWRRVRVITKVAPSSAAVETEEDELV